jgi:guanylate kinase
MSKGLLIILSGPSGVGKGTIRKRIVLDESLNIAYSISMTTRPKREFEKDGIDYDFVTDEVFDRTLNDNLFLESSEFVGYRYGTLRHRVDTLRQQGKNVFLEIEINGAQQVMKQVKDQGLVTIFLMPPSFLDLETRIRKRRSESEAIIQQRLLKAKNEMTLYHQYQHVVVNDELERAAKQIIDIIHQRIQSRKE